MSVSVVEMTNGVTTWRWLCTACIDARKAVGWTVKAPLPLPEWARCSDCEMARQSSPGYVTPSVPFLPPDPSSRLPSRAEVARMPGVAPMKRPAKRAA